MKKANHTFIIDYKVGSYDSPNHGWVPASRDFSTIKRFYRSYDEANAKAQRFEKNTNTKTRIRENVSRNKKKSIKNKSILDKIF